MHKTTHVFPVVGARKVEHLLANIDALNISLTRKHIAYLESINPFDRGFPSTQFVSRAFCCAFHCVNVTFRIGRWDDSYSRHANCRKDRPVALPRAHHAISTTYLSRSMMNIKCQKDCCKCAVVKSATFKLY